MAIYKTDVGVIKCVAVEPHKVQELVELLYGKQEIFVPKIDHRLINVIDLTRKNVIIL